MRHRHLISALAGLGFAVLAAGSGSDNNDAGEEVTVGEVLERATPEGLSTDPPPQPPAGQCCCTFLESDAPVTRFEDEETCLRIDGHCDAEVAICVAEQARIEAMKNMCCCGATEQIIPIGDACESDCYEFFEEGDTPGSCIY